MSTGPRKPMYVRTPLIKSRALSQIAGCTVYMKMENNQPSGSFKLRGISNLIEKRVAAGCSRLVTSSGGNAGMAAAYVARHMKIPLTVYVPQSSGSLIRDRLKAEGANVVAHGSVWDEADAQAKEDAKDPTVGYIHPFDDPDVWEGHESMMFEAAEDIPEAPGLVIVSIGGGGLLVGVAQGMEKVGWGKVPILGMETEGANCFNAAVKAGHLVTLPLITSIAVCLGALTVCSEALRLNGVRPIISEMITDKQCVEATCRFLDDERVMVEPACAASVAAIYGGRIQRLQAEGKLPSNLQSILLVVCGGVGVTTAILNDWKQTFNVTT